MSLPTKIVPKPATVAVSGPGTVPSPSSQLRATLTSVSLPPGAPGAPQSNAVPPPQIPRVQPSLDDRIFPTQPGVTAVYSVPRHPGPPYTAHDITKGHPNLAGTPPGHAHSPALSQVSVPTASPYRYPKGWEAGGGSPYTTGQNAGSTPLVYSPQTQQMNAQPQSRPFATGPRPTHHQFFQRAQMQTARPTIPTNTSSLRPGSQNPTAAVYPPNQPTMMMMAPMPFPSPQAAQYYIPQYRHSTPYVGPPQPFSVQPPGSGTFYPGPGPGEYPAQYAPGPQFYPGQQVYPPSPPIIVPTPQQPPPAKREKKPVSISIRIRDPNQGGRDITEEIMAGGTGSRNPTPPVGRPSSTPTPPQVSTHLLSCFLLLGLMLSHSLTHTHTKGAMVLYDKPKLEPVIRKPSSPGIGQPEPSMAWREASAPVTAPSPPVEKELPSPAPVMVAPIPAPRPVASPNPIEQPSAVEPATPTPSAAEPKTLPPTTHSQTPNTVEPLPEAPHTLAASPTLTPKALNGHADTGAELDTQAQEASPQDPSPSPPQPQASTPAFREDCSEAVPSEVRAEIPPAVTGSIAPITVVPVTLTSKPAPAFPAPPPGLPPLVQATAEASKPADTKDVPLKAGTEAFITPDNKPEPQLQALSRKSPTTGMYITMGTDDRGNPLEEAAGDQALPPTRSCSTSPPPSVAPSALEAEERPPAPEENGEAEPMRNGAGHTSETESSDSGATPGDNEGSTGPPPDLFQEDLETNGKRQYKRDFLLGFQFMAACTQKPDGLPQISDVVLDKINQNKLPTRAVESRVISRGPDFTPAFADFGRQMSGGRGGMMNMGGGARRPPPRKIILNVSANEEVQLKKAENAWKPGMKRAGPSDDPEVITTQELFRKVRSILNKLTPQMFNQLMKQVTDLTIDTEERLKGVIDLVFEKAIDEPGFSVAYGNMCRCLTTLKVPMTDKPGTTVNFRKLLLNRCQKEFERDKVDDVVFERKQKELDSAQSSDQERLRLELEEAKDKARRRSIGNIKFIGELFKLKMLTEAIMHDCVVKLLKNHDEESLECLCRLLTTIGKDLDFEKAKPRMDQYFNQMEKIVKERKTSSRIRFMLQDVIDLRLHNWVSRRADQGPKTIEQIHKEAKIEEQEEQRKVHQQLLSKDTKRREQQREQRVQQRDETWNTVPMTKNSRTIDPTKIPKISKPQMDEKIQLGPRASLNWMKGSSGGAKASDSELSRSGGGGASLNRYSALQSTQSHQTTPPAQNLEYDTRRTLGSRSSAGRERSEKPLSPAPSRPGSFVRGGSAKELLESPALSPEEPRRELESPSVSEDKTEPERSSAREPVKAEPVVAQSPDRPALSEEEMERKSRAIIDEFLHINDYKEAVQCVDELDMSSQLHVFVRVGVESTLERSQITRDHMGKLLFQLVQQDILARSQFFKGFADTLELADDMAIDIPHIWLYLAELLSPVLRDRGFSMRELFSELSKPLLPVGRAGILFSEILRILCKQMSHRKVGTLWRESGLSWSDFLPEGEDVQDFISEQKLQFTEADCSSHEAALATTALSLVVLNQQLERLLLEDMASDEQIFDWVEANLDESQMSSSQFLRALMTAVCKAAVKDESASCRVDVAIIQRRLPVLLKYLNSDTERQLQALYALQALIVTLDQPPNLLRMFFDCLYDEDVISEDAFYKWETSKDPAEELGKGVALKSVTAFFTWLREAEEESEDN
uniref:Eukaryotic translation initiation factor 4 gamma, 3a n=1 Tax=Oncorhynchus tshawytscha TaxID=74940 RepID=A0A8C8FLU9_ONCTS